MLKRIIRKTRSTAAVAGASSESTARADFASSATPEVEAQSADQLYKEAADTHTAAVQRLEQAQKELSDLDAQRQDALLALSEGLVDTANADLDRIEPRRVAVQRQIEAQQIVVTKKMAEVGSRRAAAQEAAVALNNARRIAALHRLKDTANEQLSAFLIAHAQTCESLGSLCLTLDAISEMASENEGQWKAVPSDIAISLLPSNSSSLLHKMIMVEGWRKVPNWGNAWRFDISPLIRPKNN